MLSWQLQCQWNVEQNKFNICSVKANVIPANLFTFVGVTFFILRVPRFFLKGPIISEDVRRRSEDFRRCYKEFRLTWTQERKGTLTSLLKKEKFGKSRSSTKVDFSFLSLVLVVSVNAVMAQTFLPGVTNRNTGVRSKFLIRRRDNHILGVTLGRYTML